MALGRFVPPIDVQVVASTFASQIQPTLTPDERRRNRNGPAGLVCAIPPNAGSNWVALAESDPLQGSVRLLDHVKSLTGPQRWRPTNRPTNLVETRRRICWLIPDCTKIKDGRLDCRLATKRFARRCPMWTR